MDSPQSGEAISEFLAGVERRAFAHAKFASRNTDDALDLVQDTMFEFVRRYSDQPPEKWRGLFYRILQSRITDWHRRKSVRARILAWLGRGNGDDEEEDPLQKLPDPEGSNPESELERREQRAAIERAVRRLPLRQKQAFLLRAWEGMDVAEAAFAMGCSEGTIKTHYSRAVHALRGVMEEDEA